jgi:hypothetical protein
VHGDIAEDLTSQERRFLLRLKKKLYESNLSFIRRYSPGFVPRIFDKKAY